MTKYDNKELCLIWLDSFLGLEYKHKKALFELVKDKSEIKKFLEKGKSYICSSMGIKDYDNLISAANSEYLNSIIDGLEKRNIVAVTIESKAYPEKLKNIEFPPLVLYAKGDVSLLNKKSFGIVGSRKSLPLSIKLAEDYAEEISKCGFALVTGIAQGVDSAVLERALVSGSAISVLAGGHDNIYPTTNKNLADRVSQKGLLISEYPPETLVQKYFYPIRNRIIAALSDGVLVVSGALKSGTLYTANYTMEYGKDLFAVPYNPGIDSGAGCNDLIKRGAILTDSPKDISDFYGIQVNSEKAILTEEEKAVIQVIKDGNCHMEKICNALKKQIYEISPLLMTLEIKGAIIKNGINTFTVKSEYLEE